MLEKKRRYEQLHRKCQSVLEGEKDPVVWMATLSCLIRQEMDYFWVGFYRVVDQALVIGPYQGSLGCLHIDFNQGVCGACARRRETIIVPDVHEFTGHIACDPDSKSEIVVPVLDGSGRLRAVLDIDSEELDTFDLVDQECLENLVADMRELHWTEAS